MRMRSLVVIDFQPMEQAGRARLHYARPLPPTSRSPFPPSRSAPHRTTFPANYSDKFFSVQISELSPFGRGLEGRGKAAGSRRIFVNTIQAVDIEA